VEKRKNCQNHEFLEPSRILIGLLKVCIRETLTEGFLIIIKQILKVNDLLKVGTYEQL
jgi:hypothetical protein